MTLAAPTTPTGQPATDHGPHQVTGPWGAGTTFQHRVSLPEYRTAFVLFVDSTAFVTDPDLIETYRNLGDRYHVEPADQIPAGYRAAAVAAHQADNRVLVPGATP